MISKFASTTALLIALLMGITTAPYGAERDPEKKRPDPDPRAYRAMASRATPGTPNLDGKLDEPEWELAQEFTDFVQRNPDEGEDATERTVFKVLYDDGAIYIGVRAYDSEPDKIVGRLTRRDLYSESDWIIVSIDSYFDRRTAFEFRVNPAGVERDIYRFDDTNSDDTWNAVWDVATAVDEEGWVAEYRIPYSQLRFAEAPEQIWGFNVTRVIQRKNEESQWKPIPKEGSGWVSEYGELSGIQGINPKRRLEVLPYVAGARFMTQSVPGDPFQTGIDTRGRVGVDLRFGVTNNLTLDATINPDFGEVEADPSVVNLGVFETFFRDQRPFFVEGANIYRFGLRPGNGGQEKLFHSRRIGRTPRGFPSVDDGFVSVPDQTAILGAAKLTGKTSSGWSIGVLTAATGEEKADIITSDGREFQETVEPLTNYAVGRLQRDFRDGQSAIGGMVTAVNRDMEPSVAFLPSAAYAGGLDLRHRFWDANWEIVGKVMGSHIRGSPLAIQEAQLRSSRFFHRVDADHLSFDSTRTSLTGNAGGAAFRKIGGGHWRGNIGIDWVSPGFEVNDLGFQREADVVRQNLWIGYREFDPGKIFRNYNLNWNVWNRNTFGGERTSTGTNLNGNFTLLNYWGGWAGVERWAGALNTRVLRGGPAMKNPAGWNGWYGIHSDNRKKVRFSAGGWYWHDDVVSDGGGVWLDFTVQPIDNFRLTLGPSYNWNGDDWIFVTTGVDSQGIDRFITADISQKTVSLTTRLDWTFRTNLSLQLYAQPFVSAGRYQRFDNVVAPKADTYQGRFETYEDDRLNFVLDEDGGFYEVDQNRDGEVDFTFSNPDFNFKQFNLNLVLRWEYLAGSTAFLVWSQNKTRFDPTGNFRPGSDFGSLFGEPGMNVFRFKVNYYITP